MKTKAEIEAIADQKLREAECLLKGGFPDGAFYLGGYCVELLLKARVCKTLKINEFFLFNKGKQEAYKPYKSHDFVYNPDDTWHCYSREEDHLVYKVTDACP